MIMGVDITDTIVAELDEDGYWYLRDATTNLVSKEFFISLEIIQKCWRQGIKLTWVDEEREALPVD